MKSSRSPWQPSTQVLLERLRRIDPAKPPVVNPGQLRLAFDGHFQALDLPVRPVDWVLESHVTHQVFAMFQKPDVIDAEWRGAMQARSRELREALDPSRKRMWNAASRAGRRAIDALRWYGVSYRVLDASVDTGSVYEAGEVVGLEETLWDHPRYPIWRAIWQLYIVSHEAGMMWHAVLPDRVIVLPRPVLSLTVRTLKHELIRWSGSSEPHHLIHEAITKDPEMTSTRFSRLPWL